MKLKQVISHTYRAISIILWLCSPTPAPSDTCTSKNKLMFVANMGFWRSDLPYCDACPYYSDAGLGMWLQTSLWLPAALKDGEKQVQLLRCREDRWSSGLPACLPESDVGPSNGLQRYPMAFWRSYSQRRAGASALVEQSSRGGQVVPVRCLHMLKGCWSRLRAPETSASCPVAQQIRPVGSFRFVGQPRQIPDSPHPHLILWLNLKYNCQGKQSIESKLRFKKKGQNGVNWANMIGNKVCPELHVFKIQNEEQIHQNMMQTLLQADKSKLPLYLIIPCCPAPAQLLLASLKFNPSTSPASSGLGYYVLSGALLFRPCKV